VIRSCTRWTLIAAALAGTGAGVSGCSTGQPSPSRAISATEHIDDPIRLLEARAELETLEPTDPVSSALIESIIPNAPSELALGSPAYQRAIMTPDLIFARSGIAQIDTEELGDELDDPAYQARHKQALKLYTRARGLRQTGKFDQAIDLLTQASMLDPESGAIFRELGDALILANDHAGALEEFQRAIERGDRSPRALVHLAAQASLEGKDARVIWLASQALEARSIGDHPMARTIAGVLLGRAQINSGYLQAGAQTLGDALGSFNARSRDLRWKREIIQIMTQRPELWISAGDAWRSIGAHQRAQDAYAQARADTQNVPPALIARELASLLEQGQPAGAALALLDHLQRNASDLGPQEARWARALASIDGLEQTIAPAIAMLADRPNLTPAIRRSLLKIELETLTPAQAIARLGSVGQLADEIELTRSVLARIDHESDRYDSAVAILESNPAIARALSAGLMFTLEDPVAFMHTHAQPNSEAGELLMSSMGIMLGRPDLIEHLSTIEFTPNRSTDWIATHLQALALTGPLDLEPQTLSGPLFAWLETSPVSPIDDARLIRLRASTLLVCQRPSQAWDLIAPLADNADAQIEDLLLGAQISLALEKPEPALGYLERASELDPYNEQIYEQLFTLRSPGSATGDGEALRSLVQQLGTARPRSVLFTLIRANELARNGMIEESESMLIELNDLYPLRELGYDLLMSIWKTRSTQDQALALGEGMQWMQDRLDQNANSSSGMLALAQGLFELDAHQRAYELLSDGYARTGSFEVARAIEQLLKGPLNQPESAKAHLVNRLSPLRGIDPAIEYALYLSKQGTAEAARESVDRLKSCLGQGAVLLPAQKRSMTQVVYALAQSVEKLDNGQDMLEAITIIDEHTPKLGFELARLKILLIAQLPTLDIDRLIHETNKALSETENEQDRASLRALPIRSLLGEERAHEAISLAAHLASASNEIDIEFLISTFQVLAARGTNSDLIGVIDLFEQRRLLEPAVNLLTKELGTPTRDIPAITPAQLRADLSYLAAVLSTGLGRDEQAQAYYELALSDDPDHAWANNDYGYMLAEAGERMDFAIELLERAAHALPDEASVIDSLAWVRYKLGIFDDVIASNGEVQTRGAISLLERANELDTERENATIVLHLGDALWRGGYTDRAIDTWLSAKDMLRSRIRLISIEPNPNQRLLESLSLELEAVESRIRDARSTGKPTVAPLAGEPKSNEKTDEKTNNKADDKADDKADKIIGETTASIRRTIIQTIE